MIKIDLQKAYDAVEWIFLEQVLDEIGFPRQFTMWTLECVKTVNYSILVNGESTAQFDAAKGLRHGDPISPFLFALAMKYLSRKLNELKGNKEFKYQPKCSKLAMLIYHVHLIYCYFLEEMLMATIDQQNGSQNLILDCKELSYAGRSQLIQTVLFGIQAYWSQLFVIPSKILSTIEAYCRGYLWSGTNTITRKALIAWDKVCTPKSMGGLGLLNIRQWNKVAIAKASWDIEHKADRLWIRGLHAYYIKNQQFSQVPIPQQAGWMVRKIFKGRETMTLIQDIKTGSLIKQIYLKLIGDNERITWKTLRFGNDARPKAQFTVWLQMYGKLMIVDRLASWGDKC
ncbi:uncharacterized protein LOC142177522 [Nicotiana tabacum]|uniref:Uncharacterized protein LOC142177522 n=1 Tax=Nicotiana tabacum TaxID=4097 RepID=A0AC58TZI0_TOBAC